MKDQPIPDGHVAEYHGRVLLLIQFAQSWKITMEMDKSLYTPNTLTKDMYHGGSRFQFCKHGTPCISKHGL